VPRIVNALELLSFLTLVALVGYAIKVGALKDNWLAIVLVVIAVLSPSPYRILLRIKDWIEVRRNGIRTQNHHQGLQAHQTHQTEDAQEGLSQGEEATQDG